MISAKYIIEQARDFSLSEPQAAAVRSALCPYLQRDVEIIGKGFLSRGAKFKLYEYFVD